MRYELTTGRSQGGLFYFPNDGVLSKRVFNAKPFDIHAFR